MKKQITTISQEAIDILCNYSYPGNVRELENIIQRSVIIAHDCTLMPNHLPKEMTEIKPSPVAENLTENLAEAEKQMIKTKIQECNRNLSRAAKKLGISRVTLWRKIKKLDINI